MYDNSGWKSYAGISLAFCPKVNWSWLFHSSLQLCKINYICNKLSIYLFLQNCLGDVDLLWIRLYPCFKLLVMCASSFKSPTRLFHHLRPTDSSDLPLSARPANLLMVSLAGWSLVRLFQAEERTRGLWLKVERINRLNYRYTILKHPFIVWWRGWGGGGVVENFSPGLASIHVLLKST